MAIPRIARWLLVVPMTLCGCIGTTQAGPTDGYAAGDGPVPSKSGQKSHGRTGAPCEPPELTTGDLDTGGSAPCSGGEIGTGQVTSEPPEIHHY